MERPQSWKQARSRLREFLEEYISSSPNVAVRCIPDEIKEKPSLLSWWLKHDLDLYVGAVGSATAIVVIFCLSLFDQKNGSVDTRVLRSQLSASILLLSGCIFNVWVVYRRRFSCSRGTDSLKRREISRFLKDIERNEASVDDEAGMGKELNLVGTSLTDIYPVYRLRQRKDGTPMGGAWIRIPSLLLVRGDFVALQVGDIAPASCRMVDGAASSITIPGRERITLAHFRATAPSILSKLPRGRTTLKNNSTELLSLCNNMRIFVLLETPLEDFLREPQVQQRNPQIWRQLEAIRAAFSIVGGVVFVMTAVIVAIRNPADFLLNLSLPFMAALAVFPLAGPSCLIFIEVLGTARILVTYHPVASLRGDTLAANKDNLLLRYFLATAVNRLSLQRSARRLRGVYRAFEKLLGVKDSPQVDFPGSELVRVPPASLNVLEKLGVATAFALIDDELACEPHAVPQQLLIPSGKGLKLLDICLNYEDDSNDDSASESEFGRSSSNKKSFEVDDNDSSDSEVGFQHHHQSTIKRRRLKLLRQISSGRQPGQSDDTSIDGSDDHEVQFEDPLWWQHLPSLKCIGLACLLVDEQDVPHVHASTFSPTGDNIDDCKQSLARLVCTERRRSQLASLAKCIGFSTKHNLYGSKGDATPFAERLRLHIVSSAVVSERLAIDSHERGSEDSRWWGLLRPDSTSIVVQDKRSGAYQLVSVGDPRVITRLCQEAWQGESSTILPLTAMDRATILETSHSWKLADLDVTAFSYTPVPHTIEGRFSGSNQSSKFYLLDNDMRGDALLPNQKEKTASGEWPLVQNQMFLGILGSLVIPRQEIQGLLNTLQDAGVRFVYFSPKNMRRQKEIASQMGIDVAWNCAISLRPLDAGEEDPHRMVSTYGDWDVNAKLPHGIESVRKHLKEVDNVPLLVSLFTDVTKKTTMEMIETFQEYHDTVITIGLSHLPRNSQVFAASDLSVGVDMLTDCIPIPLPAQLNYNSVMPSEIRFISAVSAHSCAFRLRGVASAAYMPVIIAQGRASLEAATAASLFMASSCLSFSFFVLFCTATLSWTIPFVPVIGCMLHLQFVIPLVGLCMAMSDPDASSMSRVPPKNDTSITFGRREGKLVYVVAVLKALPPAVLPQLLYMIAFGEFLLKFDPDLVASVCSPGLQPGDWASVVRCAGLKEYAGEARNSAGVLALAALVMCTVVASASFVHRTESIFAEPPWHRNQAWAFSVGLSLLFVTLFLRAMLEEGSLRALPWYFYALFTVMPFLCLAWDFVLKKTEKKHYDRAEKLRRLQFETRLGMWSPR